MHLLSTFNFKNFWLARAERERTLGSETSQYQEEKKKIFIFLVAASEKERAQTEVAIPRGCKITI